MSHCSKQSLDDAEDRFFARMAEQIDRVKMADDHLADSLRYAVQRPQSKRESMVEANANTWLGLLGSLLITGLCNWFLIGPIGIWWTSAITVALCTVWSIARGYYVRRYFERRRFKLD